MSHRKIIRRQLLAAVFSLTVALLAGCADPAPTVVPWLVDITESDGPDFVHESGAAGKFHLPEIMGSGVALFDADGDGDLDAYLVNGRRDLAGVGGELTNRFYLQDAGGKLVDATEGSGLGDSRYGMGVAIGDVNNDGAPDVYLTNYGSDRLFLNKGDGVFEDATESAGLEVDGWSSSATFFDYDRDGHLDLYVARYVRHNPLKTCMDLTGRPGYCQPQAFPTAKDVLLHNDGDGRFTDVTAAAGILAGSRPGLGVVAEDFDGDGWTDLFVANDGAANLLWINRGDGTFRDEAVIQGVAYNLAGRPEAGMGIVAADLNGNGRTDLFLTHLAGETNTLYINRGSPGGFQDATAQSGIGVTSVGATGFGTAAIDLEMDGDLDLIVVNGRVTRGVEPRADSSVPAPWDLYAEPNQVLLNDGTGSFRNAGPETARFVERVEVSRGLAVGDVDGDGDVDLLISNTGASARLYRNDTPQEGAWLIVRTIDPRYSRDAIGARVTLVQGAERRTRTISRGFSYLSSSPPRAYFSVTGEAGADNLEVLWPDGLREVFPVEGVDRRLTLSRGTGRELQ